MSDNNNTPLSFGLHPKCSTPELWRIKSKWLRSCLYIYCTISRYSNYCDRPSCGSDSSSIVWVVNYWYTQVGIGKQSWKKWIIVSLISHRTRRSHDSAQVRETRKRMRLQITVSASQPPKAMLTTHTIWCHYATANRPTPSQSNQ